MLKKIIAMMLLAYPMLSAGDWVAVDITDIRAFTTQTNHYIAVSDFTNPEGCSVDSVIVLTRSSTSNWKMVHSLLLTSFVSGSAVKVRTAGCNASGVTKIDGASIYK
jgi:hypothetical protein